MRAVLVNGVECVNPGQAIAVGDRGLNYGDGLFETMLLKEGRVRLLDAHLARLVHGCERLGIDYPGDQRVRNEIAHVCASAEEGVVKYVVTRGVGGRGYRASPNHSPTRIASLHTLTQPAPREIRVRWCDMRLARNPLLAGIKHLNRIEQVLAQNEWTDPAVEEGLMLDSEGELVCATSANVFIVRGNEIATSDLRYCGIRGVMRGEIFRLANALGIAIHEEPLWPEDLETAHEVFVTNAVRGIRAVVALDPHSWSYGHVTRALQDALDRNA